MKITPLLAACLALLLTLAPRASRAADEVTFDVFYNSLSEEGEWYNTPEYGYVFQPDVAYNNDKWRPYTDGYWAQTEDGWTWVAYESFGWATYHYGRWTRLKDTGWVWVPGYEWGPGWVSWRTSDDKVGWAPLPPKVNLAYVDGKDVREEAPRARASVEYSDVEENYDTGYTPAVDEDYDIGPESYCFVETRRFGDPRLSEVILSPQENYTYVENSVNVTYISYQSDHDRRFIYNRGPDFDFIRGRCERPIQELRLERHDDLGFIRSNGGRGGNANRVQNGVLQVAAPMIARRSMDFQQVRPNKIKRTLDKPQILRGWQGGQANPERMTQLRNKIKDQARQPMPAGAAGAGRRPRPEGSAVPPAPEAAQAPGNMPPASTGNVTEQERAARHAARQGQPAAPAAAPGQGNLQGPPNDADRAARRAARQQAREHPGSAPVPAPGAPAQPPANNDADKGSRKAARQQQAEQAAQQQQQAGDADKAARKAARQQQAEQGAQQQQQPQGIDPEKAARKAARQQQAEQAAQQQQQQQQQQQAGDADHAARRAARQQQAEQGAAQQNQQQARQPRPQQQADDGAREAARAARQQQMQQQQQQQQQPQRQAQPQQQQRSPEEHAARQAAKQQQAQAQTAAEDDKKKKKDGQQQ